MATPYGLGGVRDSVADSFTATRDARAEQARIDRRAGQRMLDLQYLNQDRTLGRVLADTALGGLQSAVNLGGAFYGLGNLATLGLLEQGFGLSDNFERTNAILEAAKSDQLRYDKYQAQQAFDNDGILAGVMEYLTNPSLLGDLAATQVASVLPAAGAGTLAARSVGLGAASRGLTKEAAAKLAQSKATSAASVVGGAQMGGNAYVDAYNQAIDEGLTPQEANARALAAGYTTGAAGVAISRLPGVGAARAEGQVATKVAGVPEATGRFGRTLLSTTQREATEEYLQSGAEQAIQNLVSADETRTLMDGVAKASAMGAVGGGMLGLGMGVMPATAELRNDINDVMKESAADAGVAEAAESNIESRGKDLLEGEAAAERQTQETIEAASARLVEMGFEAQDDGTFVHPELPNPVTVDEALAIASEEVVAAPAPAPEDEYLAEAGFVLAEDGSFYHPGLGGNWTREEALEVAADNIEGAPAPAQEDEYLAEAGFVLAEDGSFFIPGLDRNWTREEALEAAAENIEGAPAPLLATDDTERGYGAYTKAMDALRSVGLSRTIVDGRPVMQIEGQGADGEPTVASLDERSAIRLAEAEGAVTPEEAREALRYTQVLAERYRTPAPVPAEQRNAPTAEVSDRQLSEKDVYEAQEVALRDNGYYPDLQDPEAYWTMDGTTPVQVRRDQALAQVGYDAAEQSAAEAAQSSDIPLPQLDSEVRLEAQGLDSTYGVADPARRREVGAAILRALADTGPQALLPAPENMEALARDSRLRQAWEATLDGAVQEYNGRAEQPINYNASMRRSKAVRGFIEGAVEQGIDPSSNEAYDYIAERARALEAEPVGGARAVGALAELANAVAPGRAEFARWRKALVRKGIAKPGHMTGPAYQKFKDATSKATITPGSAEFDAFMGNFSAAMSAAEADTTFGKRVREAYPQPSLQRASAAKARQVAGTRKKPAKPVIGAGVAPLVKTGEEAALTEPKPPGAKYTSTLDQELDVAKKAVRNTLSENYRGVRNLEQEVADKTKQARRPKQEAAEESAVVPRTPTPSLDVEAQQEVEQIVVEAERRVRGMAANLEREIVALKTKLLSEEDLADADIWQAAWATELTLRMRRLDAALAKDVPDLASWSALMKTVMASPEFTKFADADTTYKQFLKPMVDRFAALVAEVSNPDGVRIYRAILDDLRLGDYAASKLTGNSLSEFGKDLGGLAAIMDRMIADATVDRGNSQNVNPFKLNEDKYSLLPGDAPKTPMPRAEIDTMVEQFNATRPEVSYPFEVFSTVAEAQAAMGIAIPSAANGVYYDNRVAIIAENIADQKMLADVMLHERTHAGLEGLLTQDRLPAVMNRLWSNPQLRKRIQTKMQRTGDNRITAAEEVLVDMIVNGEPLNKAVFSKIRAAITRMAQTLLGVADYTMSDASVNQLLKDTGDYVRGARHELDVTASYVTNLDAYKAIFNGDVVLRSPVFSTAATSLEAFAGTGTTSAVTKFQNEYIRGRNDSLLKNIGPRATGQARNFGQMATRFAMDFMPAYQIAENSAGLFWDGALQVDLLKNFVDDKLAKENEFNKFLNEKRTTRYEDAAGKKTEYQDSVMQLANDWKATVLKRSDQADALNLVNQQGTFYKVHPDRTWEQQAKLDYKSENFTQADRLAAYRQVREQWNRLTPDSKEIYQRAQAMYASQWNARMQELANQAQRLADASTELPDPENVDTLIGTGEWKAKIDRRRQIVMDTVKKGPYSPLSRFGEYYVVVREVSHSSTGEVQRGAVVFSSGHDSRAEAEAMEAAIHDRGLDTSKYEVTATLRQEFVRQLDGMGQQQYRRIQNAIEGMFPADTESDRMARTNAMAAMQELYLQSQPDSSLLKHAISRKGIGGATLDSFRAFNDYSLKSARNIASMRWDHKIQGALGRMDRYSKTGDSTAMNVKRAEVLRAIKRQHIASQEATVSKWSSAFVTTSFAMYMTSPSQMFLNASQTAFVTMPVLAAKYGVGDTMRYIKEAFIEFVRSGARGMHSERGKLAPNSVMTKVISSLNNDGTLDFSQTYELGDMAQQSSDLDHGRVRKAIHAGAVFMRLSEVFNRETAAYVAVRGEMRRAGITEEQFAGLPEARQEALLNEWTITARDAVKSTQFIYNQSNKPAIMQGNFGRVVFQFRQFQVNMLALIYRTARDSLRGVRDPSLTKEQQVAETKVAQRQLAYMMVTQLALTGVQGSVLAPIAFALADMWGDDDDLLSAEQQFLLGNPSWLTKGAIGGLLDTQRFGFNSLVPILGGMRYMPTSDNPQDTLDHILLNSMGPTYGVATQWLDGVRRIGEGEFEKGLAMIMPKILSDAWEANRIYVDGIEDRQGIPYYQPTVYDRVMNTVGLKTSEQGEMQDRRSAIYSGTMRASNRRARLIGRYVTAPSYEARQEAIEDIAAWNRHTGGDSALVIRRSTLQRASKTRAEKEQNAAEFGVPSTRIPDTIRRLVGDK